MHTHEHIIERAGSYSFVGSNSQILCHADTISRLIHIHSDLLMGLLPSPNMTRPPTAPPTIVLRGYRSKTMRDGEPKAVRNRQGD